MFCVSSFEFPVSSFRLATQGSDSLSGVIETPMTAAYTHIVIVHLPVIGVMFTLAVMLLGLFFSDRRLILIGCAFAVVCAVGAAVAYGSGPPAFEQLRGGLDDATLELAERHALVGRAAFIGAIFAGIVALQGLLRTAADDGPSPWLARGLAVLLIIVAGLMAWTAHLGGGIRHPEARNQPPSTTTGGSP